VSARRAAELVESAALLGLPCSMVGEVDDTRSVVAERVGDAAPRPLAGALVVSLAALWAGPLCADVLARLGARVVTVESTRRPDGGRLAPRFFEALHGRSESVALDLAGAAGRSTLDRLLRSADLVIEGSRPRALEQMGIDAGDVLRSGPRVWLSITAQGRWPPFGGRVGFGDDAAAAGGLVGRVDGAPCFVADAVADPLAGLTAACAAAALVDRGGRWLVDVALARVAAAARGGWIPRSAGAPARPHPRRDAGAPLPLGRDTEAVLASLGLR
jgi:crotonobetainyl-CoA:carnitine CoA-transferase CaiB-like acyl-CoA transferase